LLPDVEIREAAAGCAGLLMRGDGTHEAVRRPSWRVIRVHPADAKSTQLAENLANARVSRRLDSMKSSVGADRIEQMPSIVPNDDIFSLSDDECVARLARAIERHDLNHLDEVAQLIGRLAVTIE
jgi:hypothetical protein